MTPAPNQRYLYAHRGARAELPENTMPAFERALKVGATALEMDVHLTADGHVVVFHDDTGRRMANCEASVARTSLKDIQTWDVGWGFVDAYGNRPFAEKGYRPPTFEEVLAHFSDIRLNVDLKQLNPLLARRTVDLIDRAGATERVLLTSFHHKNLKRLKQLGYKGPMGCSIADVRRLLLIPRFLQQRPVCPTRLQIPVRAVGIPLARQAFIAKCQELGYEVDFWTINDPQEAQKLLGLGADGIVTDDPRSLSPLWHNL